MSSDKRPEASERFWNPIGVWKNLQSPYTTPLQRDPIMSRDWPKMTVIKLLLIKRLLFLLTSIKLAFHPDLCNHARFFNVISITEKNVMRSSLFHAIYDLVPFILFFMQEKGPWMVGRPKSFPFISKLFFLTCYNRLDAFDAIAGFHFSIMTA